MSTPPPLQPEHKPESFTPSPGKTFSTVRITMECVADVVVEHDEDLDDDALAAAVKAQLSQISERARWWNPTSETTTSVVVHAGNLNPDDLEEEPPVYDRPYELRDGVADVSVEVVS